MVDLVDYLTNLLFFDIPLLYCYINLRSSVIFCLSFEDIYFSLDIYLSWSSVTVSELFCDKYFETFLILLAISLQIKSPVAFVVFWMTLY